MTNRNIGILVKQFPCILMLAFLVSGCATGPKGDRIDHLAMYGEPDIQRPDFLKKADEEFIKQAASGFNGSREQASKAWYAEGNRFMSQGDLDFAMRRFNQSWLLNPDSYLPFWGFGRVALERDQMDQAIEHLEKAVRLCDDNYQKVAVLSDTGTAWSLKAASTPGHLPAERKADFEKANGYFQESTTLDASYPNSWKRWALSLFKEGNYLEAWVKLKKAQSLGAKGTETLARSLTAKMPEPE